MLKSRHAPNLSVTEVGSILAALRAGTELGKLTHELTSECPVNSGAARRLVDIALACFWLAEGAPIGDVLTMLESRYRFELSSGARRAYAIETLWAADRHKKTHENRSDSTPKEPDYAAA